MADKSGREAIDGVSAPGVHADRARIEGINHGSAGNSLTFRSGKQSIAEHGEAAGRGPAALQFLVHLAGELSRGPVDLPCFPNIVIKIREALNDPRTTLEETVKLVGAEPRLAGRLIQTANSAAFNQSGVKVTELRTAITRLGQQLVQSAAMSFAVQQNEGRAGASVDCTGTEGIVEEKYCGSFDQSGRGTPNNGEAG